MLIAAAIGALWWRAVLALPLQAQAQTPDQTSPPPEGPVSEVPQRVEVEPTIEDTDIATRLTRILEATGWFEDPQVRVDEGVVFMSGRVADSQHKEWAARLAGNTQDVVAVVNRIEVKETSMWDLSPAWNEAPPARRGSGPRNAVVRARAAVAGGNVGGDEVDRPQRILPVRSDGSTVNSCATSPPGWWPCPSFYSGSTSC